MKKILAVGLVALLGACGAKEDHSIQYAAPRAATGNEPAAATAAQTTLSASLAPAASSDPTYGLPGLADQLATQLSDYAVAQGAPAGAAKTAAAAVRQAFDMTGMPDCAAVVQATDGSSISITWGDACHFVDTTTGDTMDVRGTFSWAAATGVTEWHLTDTMTMAVTDGMTGQPATMTIFAKLDGLVTLTASRIFGGSTSYVSLSEGPITMGLTTTLTMDLDYRNDPMADPAFCITGGTLQLTQIWGPRPVGMTYEVAPDLGWKFEWTGCNVPPMVQVGQSR